MSVEALTVVLNHSKARGTEKLVLIGIANHHGDAGAWPSVARLAGYSNMSERRVQQAIKALQVSGELTVKKGGGAGVGKYKTNLYWINVKCPPNCSGFPQHSQTKPASPLESQTKPASLQDETRFALEVKPSVTKPIEEPLIEPTLKGWEEFWDLYPRSESKAEALKAYQKTLKKKSAEYLLERLNLYIAHNKKHDIKFAYAATWLNKERYLDEYDQVQKSQADYRAKIDQEHKDRMREYEELQKASAPPPKCPHGNSVVSCRECLKG